MLDDPMAVRRVGELEAEDLGVLLRLLKAVPRVLVGRFGLDDRDREVSRVAQKVISSLLR